MQSRVPRRAKEGWAEAPHRRSCVFTYPDSGVCTMGISLRMFSPYLICWTPFAFRCLITGADLQCLDQLVQLSAQTYLL